MGTNVDVKNIEIDGKKWTIVLANKRRGFMDQELDGLAAYDTRTIYLARRLGRKQRASTLLHEILHAIAPNRAEATVRMIERDLFPILWKQGWRPY